MNPTEHAIGCRSCNHPTHGYECGGNGVIPCGCSEHRGGSRADAPLLPMTRKDALERLFVLGDKVRLVASEILGEIETLRELCAEAMSDPWGASHHQDETPDGPVAGNLPR